MPTNYPGGLDSFSNPSASDKLDSSTVPHATQHANANDAIEAIEGELGVNPSGASASVVARLDDVDEALTELDTETLKLTGDQTATGTKRFASIVVKENPADIRHPDFGGVDPTGVASSSAAIQAAIDSLTSGGVVFIPPGSYNLTANLTMPRDNIHIEGAGRESSGLRTSTGHGIVNDGTTRRYNWGIRHLSLTNNGAKAGIGIDFNEVDRSAIEHCRIVNWDIGVRIRAESLGAYHNLLLSNRITSNNTGVSLIGTQGANQTHIYGGEISINSTVGINVASPTDGVQVLGVSLESNALAISCDGRRNRFMPGRFEANTQDTLFGANSSYNVLDVTFFEKSKHTDNSGSTVFNTVLVNGWSTAGVETKEPIATLDSRYLTGSMTNELADNAYLAKIRPKTLIRATSLAIVPTVQAGNIDLAIASITDVIASTGVVAMGAINTVQSVALTAPIWLEPNRDYWLIVGMSDATAAVLGVTGSSAAFAANTTSARKKGSMMPLAGKSAAGLSGTNRAPWIRLN